MLLRPLQFQAVTQKEAINHTIAGIFKSESFISSNSWKLFFEPGGSDSFWFLIYVEGIDCRCLLLWQIHVLYHFSHRYVFSWIQVTEGKILPNMRTPKSFRAWPLVELAFFPSFCFCLFVCLFVLRLRLLSILKYRLFIFYLFIFIPVSSFFDTLLVTVGLTNGGAQPSKNIYRGFLRARSLPCLADITDGKITVKLLGIFQAFLYVFDTQLRYSGK